MTAVASTNTFSLEFGLLSHLTGDARFSVCAHSALLLFVFLISVSPIGSVSTLVGCSVVKGRFGCSVALHLHGIKRSSLGLVGNHIDVFSGVWTHTDSTIGT